MTPSVAQTTIASLIVHEIPKNRASDGTGRPVLSEIVSPLNREVREFFENHLRVTLDSAFPIEFLSSVPTVKDLTDRYLNGKLGFVDYSQHLANHLFDAQTGVNSPGLLCVAACKNRGDECVAMLKLEKEEGLRVQKQRVSGQETFSVLHVRDLMLTNKTRVFKAAMILPRDGEVFAWACDQQKPGADAVASFFLLNFLGAKLVAKPEVLTRDFMDAVEGWIRTDVPDPETKTRYQVALMAELNSYHSTVTPGTFAADHLDHADRQGFFAALIEGGAQTKRFPKNTMLVRNRLKKVQFELEGQIAVTCPPEAVGDAVKISGDANDALIVVEGKLQRMRGR